MEQENKYKNKTIIKEKYSDIKYLKLLLFLMLLMCLFYLISIIIK